MCIECLLQAHKVANVSIWSCYVYTQTGQVGVGVAWWAWWAWWAWGRGRGGRGRGGVGRPKQFILPTTYLSAHSPDQISTPSIE